MANLTTKKSTRKKSSSRGGSAMTEKSPMRRADIHPLDRAIAELRVELTHNPDDPTLLGRLGALFYRRGDLTDAEKYYRQAIARAPNRPSLYNNLGNVFCDMGHMRDGINAYEQAMAIEKSLYPDREPSAEAVVNLELARVEFRLIHERIDYLERAAQLEVSSDEAQNALGCAYLLRGDGEKALRAFRQAAEMNPRNRFAGLNIAFTHTLNLTRPLNLKETLAEVSEAIMRFPHEARLQIHQGELLESAGMLEDAAQRYLRAAQADPRCLEAFDLLGRLREALGVAQTRDDVSRGISEILRCLEKTAHERQIGESGATRALPLYDLACVAVARARFKREAIESYSAVDALLREAVSVSSIAASKSNTDGDDIPDVPARAAILRAQLLHADGRDAEALVILENASAVDPRHARLWFERGSLALRSGDIVAALEYYEHAMLCAPQDALPCHSLRFAFEGYRRYRTERVRFETALRSNPRDGLAHHHLALAALSVLKNEEALAHFTRALELDPRLSDAACGRGRALQRLGHLSEAEMAYTKALDIDPENTEAHRSLMTIRSQKLLDPSADEPQSNRKKEV